MKAISSRLIRPVSGLVLLALAACGEVPAGAGLGGGGVPAEYQARPDGERVIPAVNPAYLSERNKRRWVKYEGPEGPGTIVVDPHARLLYHVTEPGLAMRFGIAVGSEGRGFSGNAVVNRKEEYPWWAPTRNMIRQDPDLYGPLAGGLPGGLDNPLGARALYLYRNGRDTMYRIHGTMDPGSIGKATSAGCIRLFNQDIVDLYDEMDLGTRVKVRTRAESLALEGPMVELSSGYLVPATAVEVIEADRAAVAAGRIEPASVREAEARARAIRDAQLRGNRG